MLAIRAQGGAHVSDEAPLKLELTGTQAEPAKTQLALQGLGGARRRPGQQYADPRFEVPFTAAAAGTGTLEAKLTFFICTEKLCARQQKTLLPSRRGPVAVAMRGAPQVPEARSAAAQGASATSTA